MEPTMVADRYKTLIFQIQVGNMVKFESRLGLQYWSFRVKIICSYSKSRASGDLWSLTMSPRVYASWVKVIIFYTGINKSQHKSKSKILIYMLRMAIDPLDSKIELWNCPRTDSVNNYLPFTNNFELLYLSCPDL